MSVSISEAFGYSLLGIVVVFGVLVFLMCITYILAAIFKRRAAKAKSAAPDIKDAEAKQAEAKQAEVKQAEVKTAPVPEAPPPAVAEKASIAVSAPMPVATKAGASAAQLTAHRKYKVVINGNEQIVEAEVPEAVSGSTVYAPRTTGVNAGQADGGAKARQFNVVINGVAYAVDAEIEDTVGV